MLLPRQLSKFVDIDTSRETTPLTFDYLRLPAPVASPYDTADLPCGFFSTLLDARKLLFRLGPPCSSCFPERGSSSVNGGDRCSYLRREGRPSALGTAGPRHGGGPRLGRSRGRGRQRHVGVCNAPFWGLLMMLPYSYIAHLHRYYSTLSAEPCH